MFADDFVSIWPVLLYYFPWLGFVVIIVVLAGVFHFLDDLSFQFSLKFPKIHSAFEWFFDRIINISLFLFCFALAIAILFSILGIQL